MSRTPRKRLSPGLKPLRHPAHPIHLRRWLAAGAVALLVGCAAATGPSFNVTTVISDYNAELFAESAVKKVVITDVNLGPPTRNYLKREEARVDAMVADYLRSNGYEVLPQREFSQRWNNAVLVYGDPVDPTTGRSNMKTFIQIMQTVRDQMREQTDVDAFVFTDLLEREVTIDAGINRIARFDGVTRKPQLQGAGDGVSTDFNWAAPVAAASLQITFYNMELDKLYAGRGGIDLTEAIDTRTGSGWIRRREVLGNDDFIEEAIQLALHPLIIMDNWPGQLPDTEG